MSREGSYLGNLLLPLILLGITGLFFFLSFDFPDQGEEVGAASVPRLWMLCMVAFCVVLIINALLKKGTADPLPGNIWFVFGFAKAEKLHSKFSRATENKPLFGVACVRLRLL